MPSAELCQLVLVQDVPHVLGSGDRLTPWQLADLGGPRAVF